MPTLYGKRLRLRTPEREDIPLFVRWVNDPDVTEHLGRLMFMNTVKEEAWFDAVCKGPEIELPLVIEIRQEQDQWKAIGNISFMGFDPINRSAEIGIMIGEKEFWDQGYGTEAMRLMCDHGFNTLNLNRIELRVFEGNDRGKNAYRKVGFVHEGTLRDVRYHKGRYWDEDVMSILKQDWKV